MGTISESPTKRNVVQTTSQSELLSAKLQKLKASLESRSRGPPNDAVARHDSQQLNEEAEDPSESTEYSEIDTQSAPPPPMADCPQAGAANAEQAAATDEAVAITDRTPEAEFDMRQAEPLPASSDAGATPELLQAATQAEEVLKQYTVEEPVSSAATAITSITHAAPAPCCAASSGEEAEAVTLSQDAEGPVASSAGAEVGAPDPYISALELAESSERLTKALPHSCCAVAPHTDLTEQPAGAPKAPEAPEVAQADLTIAAPGDGSFAELHRLRDLAQLQREELVDARAQVHEFFYKMEIQVGN